MSKQYKWQRREARRNARKNRIPKHGRSLFVIEEVTQKKSELAEKELRKENIRKKRRKAQQIEDSILGDNHDNARVE